MTDGEIIKQMRATLVPNGTAPIVQLFISGGYYKEEFVFQCIDYLEKKLIMVNIGMDTLSPIEGLAIDVLLDSAYIKRPKVE